MTPELPPAIAGYFAADKGGDIDAVAACFAEDATVKDEGKTIRGRDAVRAWKQKASQAYRYTAEPFAVTNEADRTIVTAHVSGDFPGSPVDLRYVFALNDGKISALEVLA